MKLCIINHPNTSNLTPLRNFIQILLATRVDLHLIIGNTEFEHHKINKKIKFHIIQNNVWKIALFRTFNYIKMQLQIAAVIVQLRKKVDVFIFFIGGDTLLIPNLCAKILRKKVLLLLAGSSIKTHKENQDKLTFALKLLREPCLTLADKIIVYSPTLVQDYELEQYRHKIVIGGQHYLDYATFSATTPYLDRPSLIGYIGRLSGEKGVQHFAKALPAILNQYPDLRAVIGGNGQLKDSIESTIQDNGLTASVDLPGWIEDDELPQYLNQLRLLILPSFTEGLPHIILETMACGTPVLATPVGSIPDVIIDGKTGFIMENNTPECIVDNVARALACPELMEIAEAGRRHVEKEYRFEKVVERWRDILKDIKKI